MYVLTKRDDLIDWLAVSDMSGRELARRAGLSQGTVNGLLAGRHTTVNRRTAYRIAKALGTPPNYFFQPLVEVVRASNSRQAA